MYLEAPLKQRAHELGFELVGIAAATPADHFERLADWLAQGYAGEMEYMYRQADARRHPSSILPEVKSVVMVGMNYANAERGTRNAEQEKQNAERRMQNAECKNNLDHRSTADLGLVPSSEFRVPSSRVAQYALGSDYHDVLRDRLNQLLDWVKEQAPGCSGRGVVDTAPLLERDFAQRAGLGWVGKNTMLINKHLGSFIFLGALLLDIELKRDTPHHASHCGTCTACLDACPTDAFISPGVLDSRRCISYLTIELRGEIPTELREGMGDWLFGCDICQDVCPWNRKAPASLEPAFRPRPDVLALDPIELLSIDDDEFRRRFRGTALMRTKRRGLLRNAAIVLGNRGDPVALPALECALHDPEPIVREAAVWAIERIAEKCRTMNDE